MNELNPDHDGDLYLWANQQAKFLKNGEFNKLDIINLVEEIESLGRSEKRTLRSFLIIVLIHMLKIRFQPAKHTRSWDLSIKNARNDFRECLSENPSLKSKLPDILLSAYFSARLSAAQETGLNEETFPEKCPWEIGEIIQ